MDAWQIAEYVWYGAILLYVVLVIFIIGYDIMESFKPVSKYRNRNSKVKK